MPFSDVRITSAQNYQRMVDFLKMLDYRHAVSGNTKGINKLSQTIDWEWPLGTGVDSGLRIFAVVNPEAIMFNLAQK
jgi:hypothetical protein